MKPLYSSPNYSIRRIKNKLKAIEKLKEDVPDIEILRGTSVYDNVVYYTDDIEKLNPEIKIINESENISIYISKKFSYKVANKKYTFTVFQKNLEYIDVCEVYYPYSNWYSKKNYENFTIKCKDLHKTLKDKFSTEFIDKLVNLSNPALIKMATAPGAKVAKNYFIPPKIKLLMNFT